MQNAFAILGFRNSWPLRFNQGTFNYFIMSFLVCGSYKVVHVTLKNSKSYFLSVVNLDSFISDRLVLHLYLMILYFR